MANTNTKIDMYVRRNSGANLPTDKTVWVLTADVINPKPDRRQKYDWTKRVTWKAGTRFTLRLQEGYMADITTGRWSQHTETPFDSRWGALAPFLEQEKATLQEQINQGNIPEIDVIDKLIALGHVTTEQVEDAIRLVRVDMDEEG